MGGGGLFRSLLDAGRVDAIEIAVVPVLLGAGVPLLPGEYDAKRLELVASRALGSGIVMGTYRPVCGATPARAAR